MTIENSNKASAQRTYDIMAEFDALEREIERNERIRQIRGTIDGAIDQLFRELFGRTA